MTLMELLALTLEVPVELLRQIIEAAAEAAPDLAEPIAELLRKLNEAVTPANIAILAQVLPKEFLEIFKGHLNSRIHASDAG
jgi:hypothetical protein